MDLKPIKHATERAEALLVQMRKFDQQPVTSPGECQGCLTALAAITERIPKYSSQVLATAELVEMVGWRDYPLDLLAEELVSAIKTSPATLDFMRIHRISGSFVLRIALLKKAMEAILNDQ